VCLFFLGSSSSIKTCEGILYGVGAVMLFSVIRIAWTCEGNERKRMFVLIAMLPFYLAFWASFEQAGASINLFTERHVNRMLMGMEINTTWFQSLNPFFIIILAPIFSSLWLYLGRRGKEPLTPIKFALALFLVGVSFWFLKHRSTRSVKRWNDIHAVDCPCLLITIYW